jgi:hypothetical protein
MTHTVLFSGRMIGKPGAKTRLPASMVPAAERAIRAELQSLLTQYGREGLHGVAAAACGGDILFHEACLDLGIPGDIYLAIPAGEHDPTGTAHMVAIAEAALVQVRMIIP